MTIADHVVDLADVRAGQADRAGAKLARLGELAARGRRVPDGYVVTAGTFERWLPPACKREAERLFEDWPQDARAREARAADVRATVESAPVAAWLDEAVRAAHDRLRQRSEAGSDPVVAVRSSGVAEDGAKTSFAGQFDTYLGVRGAPSVLEHVRRCWASVYSARAIDYRRRHGLPLHAAGIAVGVLQLVDARSAGVVFTADPVTGDRDTIVIEANWGLGETVVSGTVTPDHWVVERGARRIREARIAAKPTYMALDAASGRVVEGPVPAELREQPSLTDAEVLTLCDEAASIEDDEGAPQDLEWAIDRSGALFLLQHRPVTTAPAPPPEPYDSVQYALRNVFKVPGL